MGANNYTYLDVKFNGNATRDVNLLITGETNSHTGAYASLLAFTDQGTGDAGIAYDLNYFNADTTTVGTTHLISSNFSGSFSHLAASGTQASRWRTGTTDFSIRVSSSGGWFGLKSNHPINFYTNNTLAMVLESDGDLTLNYKINFGSRLGQHVNLYSSTYRFRYPEFDIVFSQRLHFQLARRRCSLRCREPSGFGRHRIHAIKQGWIVSRPHQHPRRAVVSKHRSRRLAQCYLRRWGLHDRYHLH